MRKLTRKSKNDSYATKSSVKKKTRKLSENQKRKRRSEKLASPENVKKAMSRPLKKKYKKMKCAFVSDTGKKCRNNAVGKGTLCKLHGGVIPKEDLLPDHVSDLLPQSKYDPENHPIRYIQFAQQGLADVEIAALFEVSLDTLKNWADTYQNFAIAFETGKAMQEAWWIREGKQGLNDRFFNTNLFKFMTSNLIGYSDKMETKSTNMNIHGVLVVPDPVQSIEEWEEVDDDVIDVEVEK